MVIAGEPVVGEKDKEIVSLKKIGLM